MTVPIHLAHFSPAESPGRKKTLYGTTFSAGILSGCGGFGCGTIFRLVGGNLTTLWSFSGGVDGGSPGGTLIADEETGALYGTTSGVFTSGNGTVFKIDTIDQSLRTIYSFLGSPDGASPGKVLLADDGALYGMTFAGGVTGKGTVFKLTPPGWGQTAWTETVLWSFTGGNDGANPVAGLIADKSGALYGTTSAGGACPGCGTVFRLAPPTHGQTSWTLSTLYAFTGGSDGGSSFAGLIPDGSGALYGTTQNGGTINTASCPSFVGGCGVVFKLIPREHGQVPWTETVLWTFSGGSDGSVPQAELIADGSGALYGTTVGGGNVNPQGPCGVDGCGVVFKLTGTGFVPKDED
jgi:uncharacterized repeat protein (TIGR03803 family)